MEDAKVLTSKQACAVLNIHRATLWKLEKSKKIAPIYIVGAKRWRMSDIVAFIEGANSIRQAA